MAESAQDNYSNLDKIMKDDSITIPIIIKLHSGIVTKCRIAAPFCFASGLIPIILMTLIDMHIIDTSMFKTLNDQNHSVAINNIGNFITYHLLCFGFCLVLIVIACLLLYRAHAVAKENTELCNHITENAHINAHIYKYNTYRKYRKKCDESHAEHDRSMEESHLSFRSFRSFRESCESTGESDAEHDKSTEASYSSCKESYQSTGAYNISSTKQHGSMKEKASYLRK